MSCFLGEWLHPLLLHFEGQWGDEGEGVKGELGFRWNLCTFTHKLIAGISLLPFCVLVLFICCTHYPLLLEMIHYTVEQLNWQMQSTTLLCPTSPSCLPFAPAITNLFSLSPNPYTSPFILSPSITHFPSFKSSSAILSSPFFLLSLSRFLSSISRLNISLSSPISSPSSYLSRSLSGVEEAGYHLEEIAFARHVSACTRTQIHTHTT